MDSYISFFNKEDNFAKFTVLTTKTPNKPTLMHSLKAMTVEDLANPTHHKRQATTTALASQFVLSVWFRGVGRRVGHVLLRIISHYLD